MDGGVALACTVCPMSDVKPDSLRARPAEDPAVPVRAAGRGAKPLRLPVWKCPRCGARKRLRGARHGEREA